MFSSLSLSSLLLIRLHGLLLLPSIAADPSIVLRLRARHILTHLVLSDSSIAFLLFLLVCFCGSFGVASAAPSPAWAPSLAPEAPLASTSPGVSSLLALKAAWVDRYNNLASWDPALSVSYCQTWRGVTCGKDGSTITSLNLAFLSLSGPLPASIADLSSLRSLYLDFNELNGSIPAELGSLSSLKILRLRHNRFNGSIPDSLFKATSLQFLLLENNNLSGSISPSVSNLVKLVYLSFGDNVLSGPLPASITDLSNLVALFGGYNKLTGTIPVHIGNLRRLIHFDLQGNRFTGAIPGSIGSCTGLLDLILSENQLTGTLPVELGSLSSLQTLDLHQNNISGSISSALGNLTMLKSLNLSYNNLSGKIPTNGVLSNFSANSFEGNALLCGRPLANLECVSSPPPIFSPPPPPILLPAPSPMKDAPRIKASSMSSKKRKIITGAVVGGIALLLLVACIPFMLRKWRVPETAQIQNRLSPDRPENADTSKLEMFTRGFKLTYEEIVSHAGYYDTAHVVGKGRFAIVYRSDLPGGTQMAVKVFKNPIPQAAFEKEIEGLELASHFNTLLPIKGYFASESEKAIFYDFMQLGSLYDLLHNNPGVAAQLDWSKRLNIATGIAQAVAHLHKGSSLRVLHKDLKSTNVFLDEAMYPLVADYGLIGLVSRSLVETPGYTPPELKTTKKYTERTDVYSFGVVLLEILTGKKPVSYIGDRQLNLVTWALRLQRDGRGREVFSANLVESCPYPDYPDRALNLAILCLSDQPAQRPTMSECASILEGLGGNNSPLRSPGIQQDRPLLV